jgi:hypothetical protein
MKASKAKHQDKRRRFTGPSGRPAANSSGEVDAAGPGAGTDDLMAAPAAAKRPVEGQAVAAVEHLQPLEGQWQTLQKQQQQPQQQLQQSLQQQQQQQSHQGRQQQQQQCRPAAEPPLTAAVPPALQPAEVITIDSSDDSE